MTTADAASAPPAVEVRGLRKTYGTVEALRGLDLHVARGEVFALLGPNGAGKTTTVEILEGYRQRDSGDVSVLGHDPGRNERELKERLGIVLQSTGVEPYLTVAEVVTLHAGYYPHPRDVDEVLRITGLREQRDRRIKRLSGGQRRRVDLAVALAGDPDLLFLDEPTTGFDPSARRQAWETIRDLAALGKTILLTTHYMDEAQALADRLSIIAAGRVVGVGTARELMGAASRTSTITFRLPPNAELSDHFGASRSDGAYRLETENPTRLLHALTEWALAADTELLELEVSRRSLEAVYLELTRGAVTE